MRSWIVEAYPNLVDAALGRDAAGARLPFTRLTVAAAALVLTVLAGAALLRAAVVPKQALWADELFSLAMASGHSLEHPRAEAVPALGDFVEPPGPVAAAHFARLLEPETPPAGVGRVVRAVFLSDTSPPLYYLALAAWMRAFGAGDRALRFFSVAASLGALALLVPLTRQAAGRAAVLPAAVLFALSPLAVYYSSEGRMYALVWLWTVAAMGLALHMHARGARVALLAAYAVVGACGLLTHYFFLPAWLAASAWLLARPGRARRLRVAASLLATAALVAPWYARLPASLARWRVTGDWLRMPNAEYHPLLTPLGVPWGLFSIRAAWGVPLALDAVNGLLVLSVMAVGGLRLGRRLFATRPLLLWLVAGASVATPVLADLVLRTHGAAHPRYALAALPAALVLLALAASALRPRARALAGALFVALALAGDWRVAHAGARNAQAFWPLAAHLRLAAGPDDVVVVHSIPSGVCGVARYADRRPFGPLAAPVVSWVPRLGGHRVPEDLARVLAGRRRALLVKVHTLGDATPEEEWLRREGRQLSSHWFEAISVVEFEPRSGARFP